MKKRTEREIMNDNRAGLHPTRVFALKLLAFVFAWTGLLFGTLQLVNVPMPALQGLCGAYG